MKKKLDTLKKVVKAATQQTGVYVGEVKNPNAYVIETYTDGKFIGVLVVNEDQMDKVLKVLNEV